MTKRLFSTLFFAAILYTEFFQASETCTKVVRSDREVKVNADLMKVIRDLKQDYLCDILPSLIEENLLMSDTADGFGQKQKRFLKLVVENQYLANKRLAATCDNHAANAIFRLQREAVHTIYACQEKRDCSGYQDETLEREKAQAYIAAYREGLRFRAALQ